jgi:hypothetical protein
VNACLCRHLHGCPGIRWSFYTTVADRRRLDFQLDKVEKYKTNFEGSSKGVGWWVDGQKDE